MTRWFEGSTCLILACSIGFVGCEESNTNRARVDGAVPEASASLPDTIVSSFPKPAATAVASETLPDGLEATPARTGSPVQPVPGAQAECPADMVLVQGEYCPGLVQPCEQWVKGGVRRCAKFGESRCVGHRFTRRFCIDRYEYPNVRGVKPAVMVDWYDALRACEIEGKRMCLVSEWNFACEGAQRQPYPYGYTRDRRVCNFDRPRPSPEPKFDLFARPRQVGAEVARLDMRIESGRLEGCVSPFGVHDMTGNVDEWTLNEDHFDQPETEDHKPPYISGLKGGYWGPIRAACRPITTAHDELFRFYQVGFRCCANTKSDSDGVADRYTHRLSKWREKAGLRPEGGSIERPPK